MSKPKQYIEVKLTRVECWAIIRSDPREGSEEMEGPLGWAKERIFKLMEDEGLIPGMGDMAKKLNEAIN